MSDPEFVVMQHCTSRATPKGYRPGRNVPISGWEVEMHKDELETIWGKISNPLIDNAGVYFATHLCHDNRGMPSHIELEVVLRGRLKKRSEPAAWHVVKHPDGKKLSSNRVRLEPYLKADLQRLEFVYHNTICRWYPAKKRLHIEFPPPLMVFVRDVLTPASMSNPLRQKERR